VIALLGGSFDPIHEGHIHLAKTLLSLYPFEKLFFVPAAQNPLKDTTQTPKELRLEMAQAAIAETKEPRLAVLDFEIHRPSPSYTLSTVDFVRENISKDVTLILGNEVFQQLPDWHKPREILEKVDCVVIPRTEEKRNIPEILNRIGIKNFREAARECFFHSEPARRIEVRSVSTLPYSSTGLRLEIKKMWEKDHTSAPPQGIQRSVWLLIKGNRLYTR
jgi:nicotinate-nucleotide adenylyltransferase